MNKSIELKGLLVTRDLQLMSVMERVMDSISVEANVCLLAQEAIDSFPKEHLDCVVLDWEIDDAPTAILRSLRASQLNGNCSVVALISDPKQMQPALQATANLVMFKPRVFEQGLRCLRPVYAAMLRQRREAFRVPVKMAAVFTQGTGSKKGEGTITDISETGMAVRSSLPLEKGDTLQVEFSVPGKGYRAIIASCEVIWSSKAGAAGLKFSFINPAQRNVLVQWLDKEVRSITKNSSSSSDSSSKRFFGVSAGVSAKVA